jgi:hypothetical protein
VRLERVGSGVTGIAFNQSAPAHPPRLEHDAAQAIRHRDVEPGAAGRIAGRKFVTGQITNDHIELQRLARHRRPLNTDGGGILFELPHRRLRGGFKLRRRGLHVKLVAKAVQNPKHEGVSAEERVPGQARPPPPSTEATRTGPATPGM